jgi:hypothetical protein
MKPALSRMTIARATPKLQRGQYGDVGSRSPIRDRIRLMLLSAALETAAGVPSKPK